MYTHTWQDLANAQEAFVHLLGQLNPECKIDFLEWVCREYNPSMEPGNAIAEEPESGQSASGYSKLHPYSFICLCALNCVHFSICRILGGVTYSHQ